jgi:hypothetical protein
VGGGKALYPDTLAPPEIPYFLRAKYARGLVSAAPWPTAGPVDGQLATRIIGRALGKKGFGLSPRPIPRLRTRAAELLLNTRAFYLRMPASSIRPPPLPSSSTSPPPPQRPALCSVDEGCCARPLNAAIPITDVNGFGIQGLQHFNEFAHELLGASGNSRPRLPSPPPLPPTHPPMPSPPRFSFSSSLAWPPLWPLAISTAFHYFFTDPLIIARMSSAPRDKFA